MDSWDPDASPYSAYLLYASSVSECDNQLPNSHSSMRDALHILARKEIEEDGWIPGFQQKTCETGMGTQLDYLCDSKGDLPHIDHIQTDHRRTQV